MEENNSESYEEKIQKQQELVKRLADEYKMTPTEATKLELTRETDTLRQLTNAAKGEPKERARKAAEFAYNALLNRAVLQVPPED